MSNLESIADSADDGGETVWTGTDRLARPGATVGHDGAASLRSSSLLWELVTRFGLCQPHHPADPGRNACRT